MVEPSVAGPRCLVLAYSPVPCWLLPPSAEALALVKLHPAVLFCNGLS